MASAGPSLVGQGRSRARAGACASRPGRAPPPPRGGPSPGQPWPALARPAPRAPAPAAEPRAACCLGCGCAVSPLPRESACSSPQLARVPIPGPTPPLESGCRRRAPGRFCVLARASTSASCLTLSFDPVGGWGLLRLRPLARPVAGAGQISPIR